MGPFVSSDFRWPPSPLDAGSSKEPRRATNPLSSRRLMN